MPSFGQTIRVETGFLSRSIGKNGHSITVSVLPNVLATLLPLLPGDFEPVTYEKQGGSKGNQDAAQSHQCEGERR